MAKTIKIRILRGCVGQDFVYAAGQIVDAPEDRARDLVQANYATLVSTTEDVETATDKAPVERRVKAKK